MKCKIILKQQEMNKIANLLGMEKSNESVNFNPTIPA